MDDHQNILKLVSEGNQLAFRSLYGIYCGMVYNTALSFVPDVQQAEEVTQEVFTNIFRSADSFNGKSSVKTWIYRITVNTSLNQIKKNKRHQFSPEEHITKVDFDHPGILMENKENAEILSSVINSLSENQKAAFVLSYIEGLPRQEVANIMNVGLKAVESLLQRAKQNLRQKLEKVYPNRRKK